MPGKSCFAITAIGTFNDANLAMVKEGKSFVAWLQAAPNVLKNRVITASDLTSKPLVEFSR